MIEIVFGERDVYKRQGQVRSGDREGAEADAAAQNLSRQAVHQASDEPECLDFQGLSDLVLLSHNNP